MCVDTWYLVIESNSACSASFQCKASSDFIAILCVFGVLTSGRVINPVVRTYSLIGSCIGGRV